MFVSVCVSVCVTCVTQESGTCIVGELLPHCTLSLNFKNIILGSWRLEAPVRGPDFDAKNPHEKAKCGNTHL